jgi:hypothetical protein
MKPGDLVKHCNAPWFGIITRVKRFTDPPAGIQHVELIWIDSGNNAWKGPRPIDTIASSLLLMVSEA